MASWVEGENGHYLTCPEGFAFIGRWANASYVYAIIYFREGRVEQVPYMDRHEPFRGVTYATSVERAKAVVESILCPRPDTRPTAWEKLGVV